MIRLPLIVTCITLAAAPAHAQSGRGADHGFNMGELQRELREFDRNAAADSGAAASETAAPRPHESFAFTIARVAGYLALVVGLIVVLAWLARRSGLAGSSRLGGGSMDLLETLPLGQNKSVALVRIADAVFVLGQTANSVAVLDKIEGDKAVELISSSKGIVSMTKFKDAMNVFLNRMKK